MKTKNKIKEVENAFKRKTSIAVNRTLKSAVKKATALAACCGAVMLVGCAAFTLGNTTHVLQPGGNLTGKRHVTLGVISQKNLNFTDLTASNFRDNLRFELVKAGFAVQLSSETLEEPKATISAELIAGICRRQKTELLVTGYVFETQTGDLLEEQISAGVYLRVHDSTGKLAAHLRYVGKESLESYEMSALVAETLAGALSRLADGKAKRPYLRLFGK